METSVALAPAQYESLVHLARAVPASSSLDFVLGRLAEALSEHRPGAALALRLNGPEGFMPAGEHADRIFRVAAERLGDVTQVDPEPVALAEVPGGVRVPLAANRQVYGAVLAADEDTAFAGALARLLAPLLGMAVHALRLEEEVNKRTSTDRLTGLWNRVYFNERFREECERLVRSRETGSVAVVGLPEFAAVARTMTPDEANGRYGEVGQVVRQVIRQTDWAVRWDGHDILLYLPSTSAEAAVEVLKRLTRRLVQLAPYLSPVMGVSSTTETTSPRALVQMATRRLDLARKEGGSKVICFALPGQGMNFHHVEI
ncbi:MAG: GGDEF domain-containing protein [Candidatus Sericytochromatia bacterium]|nr:GGDEF domain-containing protein [Candidatus Sericytochromatia bacterium]